MKHNADLNRQERQKSTRNRRWNLSYCNWLYSIRTHVVFRLTAYKYIKSVNRISRKDDKCCHGFNNAFDDVFLVHINVALGIVTGV